MVPMLLLDVLIRYPTVALMLLFAALAIRDGWPASTTRYAALLSISMSALLLGTAPEALRLPPIPYVVVRMLDIPSIPLVWWLGRSMFEDDFRFGRLEWTGFAALSALLFVSRLEFLGVDIALPPSVGVWIDGLSFAMMAHLAVTTVIGRADDLIGSRRALRLYFVLALAAAAVAIILAENLFSQSFDAEVSILRGAIALPLVLWGLFWLVKLSPEQMMFQPATLVVVQDPQLDPRDAPLHTKLTGEMEAQRAFAEHGLTIRTLAERLGTPEHRLRAVINQGLGHRNFSDFVNRYRIDAAKAVLRDVEQARLPVLTIAMDVGFASLAPFNRAFKAMEGVTPTAYRRAALNGDEPG